MIANPPPPIGPSRRRIAIAAVVAASVMPLLDMSALVIDPIFGRAERPSGAAWVEPLTTNGLILLAMLLAGAATVGLLLRARRLNARAVLAAAVFWGLWGIPAIWLYAFVLRGGDLSRVSAEWLFERGWWRLEPVSVLYAVLVWAVFWAASGIPWRRAFTPLGRGSWRASM